MSSRVRLAFFKAWGMAIVGAMGKSMGSTPASAQATGTDSSVRAKRSSADGRTDDFGKGLETELVGLLGGHQDECGSAIADGGRVCSGDAAALLEGRPERWDLVEDNPFVLLILLHDGIAFLAFDGYRNDFSVESARFPSPVSPLI